MKMIEIILIALLSYTLTHTCVCYVISLKKNKTIRHVGVEKKFQYSIYKVLCENINKRL